MVQISKGPIGTKGPRVTTYVSLPGRYLVFMPTVEHIGVSRRIARDEERARLKEIMSRVRRPGYGYIVRTVSEGVKEEELRSDVDFLHVFWQDVLTNRESAPRRRCCTGSEPEFPRRARSVWEEGRSACDRLPGRIRGDS